MSRLKYLDPKDCPFCWRIGRRQFDRKYNGTQGSDGAVVFEPLNPVTPGHLLIVSLSHVEHAASHPGITASVMNVAAIEAAAMTDDCNIITSVGSDATQTIAHFHVHVVPRRPDDGLVLPWTPSADAANAREQRAAALREAADAWESLRPEYRPPYLDTWLRRRALCIKAGILPDGERGGHRCGTDYDPRCDRCCAAYDDARPTK